MKGVLEGDIKNLDYSSYGLAAHEVPFAHFRFSSRIAKVSHTPVSNSFKIVVAR